MEIKNYEFIKMPAVSKIDNANSKADEHKNPPTAADIKDWLVCYIVELLEIEPDEVDITIPFDRYGLDSSAVVGMTGDLEDWLEYEIDPTLIYDYPTIEALSTHLSEEGKVKA